MNINEIENNMKLSQEEEQTTRHRSGQQGTAEPEEVAERQAQLKTQGRKGCKAVRINMAFTPENHEYIKVMARCAGTNMTEFLNIVVEQYRNEHIDLYNQAKDIYNQINSFRKK